MIKEMLDLEEKMPVIVKKIAKDERGMELLQIMIICLIGVVIGGQLLKFYDISFTEIGGLMVNKIKSIFTL